MSDGFFGFSTTLPPLGDESDLLAADLGIDIDDRNFDTFGDVTAYKDSADDKNDETFGDALNPDSNDNYELVPDALESSVNNEVCNKTTNDTSLSGASTFASLWLGGSSVTSPAQSVVKTAFDEVRTGETAPTSIWSSPTSFAFKHSQTDAVGTQKAPRKNLRDAVDAVADKVASTVNISVMAEESAQMKADREAREQVQNLMIDETRKQLQQQQHQQSNVSLVDQQMYRPPRIWTSTEFEMAVAKLPLVAPEQKDNYERMLRYQAFLIHSVRSGQVLPPMPGPMMTPPYEVQQQAVLPQHPVQVPQSSINPLHSGSPVSLEKSPSPSLSRKQPASKAPLQTGRVDPNNNIRYCGLMTEADKEFVKNVQLSQLESANPLDDYYFQMKRQKDKQAEYERRIASGKRATLPPPQRIPSSAFVSRKPYVPVSFESTLGTVPVTSIRKPRRHLDVSVGEGASEQDTNDDSVARTERHFRRHVLGSIERGYKFILDIKICQMQLVTVSHNNRQAIESSIQTLINNVFAILQLQPYENPSEGDRAGDQFFLNLLSIRKGARLMGEVAPLLDVCQLSLLFCALVRNLDRIGATTEEEAAWVASDISSRLSSLSSMISIDEATSLAITLERGLRASLMGHDVVKIPFGVAAVAAPLVSIVADAINRCFINGRKSNASPSAGAWIPHAIAIANMMADAAANVVDGTADIKAYESSVLDQMFGIFINLAPSFSPEERLKLLDTVSPNYEKGVGKNADDNTLKIQKSVSGGSVRALAFEALRNTTPAVIR